MDLERRPGESRAAWKDRTFTAHYGAGSKTLATLTQPAYTPEGLYAGKKVRGLIELMKLPFGTIVISEQGAVGEAFLRVRGGWTPLDTRRDLRRTIREALKSGGASDLVSVLPSRGLFNQVSETYLVVSFIQPAWARVVR